MSPLTNKFKQHYGDGLRGRDWIRRIDPADRDVLISEGLKAAEHGKLGGYARARTAVRDWKGRFAHIPTDDEVERVMESHMEYCQDPFAYIPLELLYDTQD